MAIEMRSDTRTKKEQISWKQIWVTVLICAVMFILLNTAWSFGSMCVRNLRGYHDFLNNRDRFDQRIDNDRYDGDRRPFDDRRGGGENLERWIAANLPPEGEKEYADVADVFRETAESLRDGKIDGLDEACAFATRNLMKSATRKIWLPFFTDLGKMIVKDKELRNQPLDDTFERIGRAIRKEAREDAVESVSDDCLFKSEPLAASKTEEKPEPEKQEEKPEQEEPKEVKPEPEPAAKPAQTGTCANGTCSMRWY